MNILYIGKHFQNNNDDEGAIYDSLTSLGHNVTRFNITTFDFDKKFLDEIDYSKYSFILFHKLKYEYILYLKPYMTVCWFFDAINKGFDSNDDYIDSLGNNINLLCLNDGDFVNICNMKNIKTLKQGCDIHPYHTENLYINNNYPYQQDILFIGTIGQKGYSSREKYLELLKLDFKNLISHNKYNVFKDNLTYIVRSTKIMLAMPPVTDHYWSNRVYLLCGRGGFLLHPFSHDLDKEFNGMLPMYDSYDELKNKIEYYLNNEQERETIRKQIQKTVLEKHCYYHRCQKLIELYNEYIKNN